MFFKLVHIQDSKYIDIKMIGAKYIAKQIKKRNVNGNIAQMKRGKNNNNDLVRLSDSLALEESRASKYLSNLLLRL